jgi:CheY-specific phosphatase CheX
MKACEFSSLIRECSSEVLDTMYFTTVLSSTPLESTESGADQLLSYNLQFVGDVSGRFGLHLNRNTARTLAANFLGETESDLSYSDIAEVVGELSNILCGSVMSRVEGEHPFVLSHPLAGSQTLTGADDFLTCVLDTDSGSITIWVLVEGNP